MTAPRMVEFIVDSLGTYPRHAGTPATGCIANFPHPSVQQVPVRQYLQNNLDRNQASGHAIMVHPSHTISSAPLDPGTI